MEMSEAPPDPETPPLAKIKGIQFGLMTTQKIMTMSVIEDPQGSLKAKDLMNGYLGLPTHSGKCLTCHAVTVDQCQGHFGHVRLSTPIFHPNHVDNLVRLLRKICLSCGKPRKKSSKSGRDDNLSLALDLLNTEQDEYVPNLRSGKTYGSQRSSKDKGKAVSYTIESDSTSIAADGVREPHDRGNGKKKRKLQETLNGDIGEDDIEWPNSPNSGEREVVELSGSVILLSSDDEQCRVKQSTEEDFDEHDLKSTRRTRKRKPPARLDLSDFGKQPKVKGPEDVTGSNKKRRKNPVPAVPSTGRGRRNAKHIDEAFENSSQFQSDKSGHGPRSSAVCKYCSASSRRLGYPLAEVKVHVGLKGERRDAINMVKVIKMEVKPKDMELLAPDYWSFVEGTAKSIKKRPIRYLLPSEALTIVRKIPAHKLAGLGFKEEIARPEAFILECLPVPPNCTRLQEDGFGSSGTNIGFKMGADKATQAFGRLLSKIIAIKHSRFGHPTFHAAATEAYTLQALFQQYLREKGAPKSAPGKEKRRVDTSGRTQNLPTRWSLDWLKKNILGKKSGFSARNVVSGDPYLGVGEIGVPLSIAKHVTYMERVTAFNRRKLQEYIDIGRELGKARPCGAVRLVRNGERREITHRTEIELEIGDLVHRHLKDGDLVFINRPPSLHKHSLLSLRAHIQHGSNTTCTINPAICAPLHADFDGDCLHIFFPQSEQSKAEIHELMTLPAQILSSPQEKTILGISQDNILATHLLISSPLYLEKDFMSHLAMWSSKGIPAPAIVKAPNRGPLWTGGQVFSMTIPDKFWYESNDGSLCIREGEILNMPSSSNWLAATEGLLRAIAEKNPEAAVKQLDCSQAILREWLLLHGFSVGIQDFYAAPDKKQRKEMKQGIMENFENAKSMATRKQLIINREFQRKNLRSFLDSTTAFKTARKGVPDLEDIAVSSFLQSQSEIGNMSVAAIPEENCLLKMVRSCSKGSISKVMQQIGCLGLQLLKGEKLLSPENNPKLVRLAQTMGLMDSSETYLANDVWDLRGLVKSSLLDGLEPHEFFIHAIAVRDGHVQKSSEISGPGELFKRLMLFLRDVHAAYDGTVRNMGGLEIIQFDYEGLKSVTNEISIETVMPGEAVGTLAATAISQPAYQGMLDAPYNIGFKKVRPLELLQESMYARSESKLKACDRLSILRLSPCDCGGKYCDERRILDLQAEMQPITLGMVATDTAIEYVPESSGEWTAFETDIRDLDRSHILPWIGHIQLDETLMIEKDIRASTLVDRIESRLILEKKLLRKLRLGDLLFCERERDDCACMHFENPSNQRAVGPCLHFAFKRNPKKKATNPKTMKQQEMDNETQDLLTAFQRHFIPLILNIVIKGNEKIETTKILWEDEAWSPPRILFEENGLSTPACGGELVLEVTVKEAYSTARGMPWRTTQESCLHMDSVDWERSSPYAIQEIKSIFGVEAARDVLLQRFNLAAGKSIGEKHLKLVADLMVHSGEVHGLTSYGYRDWMKSLKVSSPFTAGAFRAPMKHFIEAGRDGVKEKFHGVLAASVFGKKVPLGTGADFNIRMDDVTILPQTSSASIRGQDGSTSRNPGESIDICQCWSDLIAQLGLKEAPVEKNVFGPTTNAVDALEGDDWGGGKHDRKVAAVWGNNGGGVANIFGSHVPGSTVTLASGNWGQAGDTELVNDGWGGGSTQTQPVSDARDGSSGVVSASGNWGVSILEEKTQPASGSWGEPLPKTYGESRNREVYVSEEKTSPASDSWGQPLSPLQASDGWGTSSALDSAVFDGNWGSK